MQHQFDIAKPVQQRSMDDVHHVGKIQRAIHALGPTAVAAEEFPGARVAEQSFHRLFKIHAYNLPNFEENPNGVYPVSSYGFGETSNAEP